MKTLVLAILAVAAATNTAHNAVAAGKNNTRTTPSTIVYHQQMTSPSNEARAHKVVVYYRDYCEACHRLMGKISSLGVRYTAINAEGSNIPFVPLMKVDGKTYVGDRSISELKRILS